MAVELRRCFVSAVGEHPAELFVLYLNRFPPTEREVLLSGKRTEHIRLKTII